MSNESNKKQPSENMRERINELRQKIERSAQEKREGNDTLTSKDIAILNKAIQLDLFPDAVEIIRPELNIARHADFIFTSPRNKDISKRRERKLNDSNEFIAVMPGTIVSEKE